MQSLADSGPTNSAAANSDQASRPAAAKVPQSAVEKIGESDITEDDEWLNETPSAPSAAPATSAAAANFAPANRATLGQPAFQDEDDYDMDEETAAPAATAEVKQMSFPITAGPGGFSQAVPARLADAVSPMASSTVRLQPILASAPAVPPAVAPTTLALATSLARGHAAGQPAQNLLKKPTTLQQQVSYQYMFASWCNLSLHARPCQPCNWMLCLPRCASHKYVSLNMCCSQMLLNCPNVICIQRTHSCYSEQHGNKPSS